MQAEWYFAPKERRGFWSLGSYPLQAFLSPQAWMLDAHWHLTAAAPD